MSGINNTMAVLLIASVVMLIGGMVLLPALQEAQAANAISTSRDKVARGELMSDGKRQGSGGGGTCGTCE